MSTATIYLTEARRQPAEATLRLAWDDGHAADYAYTYLRGYCPCAACQGHTNEAIRFHPPTGAVDLVAIEPVGHYAISLRFSDGHGTGIYRYDFLRKICPCAACRHGSEPAEGPESTPAS